MRFRCKCGNTISNTSDKLPYAASVVADVDLEDYWEAWERKGRGQALGNLLDPIDYEQTIYQCEECGRIWFDDPEDPSRLISFMPEDKNVMVTGPIEGAEWKGYIYGFSDLGLDCTFGLCYASWNNGARTERHDFKTYEEMRSYFDSKVNELREQNLLRSAWINKDGETIYRWSLDDEIPVQEKHEIYLNDDERIALAQFQSDHAECHRKYPRGPRGWDFAYEVLPGICGADDRDLRATCLRCGATVESIDGKIVHTDRHTPKDGNLGKLTAAILDSLHDRGSQKIRQETISMPERYYDIAEAIGYVRGLVDAARIIEPETPLAEIAQRAFALLLDEDLFESTAKFRNLVRKACEDKVFDWAIEDGMEALKAVLKETYPETKPEWVDKLKNEGHGTSMLKS